MPLGRIQDAIGKKSGQDSIECDWECATWIHRQCAGLSKEAFEAASKSSDPFICPKCRLLKQEKELSELRSALSKLQLEVSLILYQLPLVKTYALSANATSESSASCTKIKLSPEVGGVPLTSVPQILPCLWWIPRL